MSSPPVAPKPLRQPAVATAAWLLSLLVAAPAIAHTGSPDHRGFAVALRRAPSGYGFEIRHERLVLHASDAAYGSAPRAERAARRVVDDALGAFDHAYAHLDADA